MARARDAGRAREVSGRGALSRMQAAGNSARRCCGPGSWWPDRMPTEFTLIDAIARRAATRDDVVLGIGDDAAILAVPAGRQLVVAMDTLNAGVHFPDDTAQIGRASCRERGCQYV